MKAFWHFSIISEPKEKIAQHRCASLPPDASLRALASRRPFLPPTATAAAAPFYLRPPPAGRRRRCGRDAADRWREPPPATGMEDLRSPERGEMQRPWRDAAAISSAVVGEMQLSSSHRRHPILPQLSVGHHPPEELLHLHDQ
ncbi:hypothetical protein BRADI_5g07213v3 [Brachypodium distachyon]|uniref:Uncharacterized protein n=1 Tax=Brachypodium distachyon TaxID=15368 RepID=A0A0Q3E7B4_BRADI|nr:hypothetical protein BRADI_5g07213v3 [Brachypodium distachyon]